MEPTEAPPHPDTSYAFTYQPILSAVQSPVALELQYEDIVTDTTTSKEVEFMANAILGAFVHSAVGDLLKARRAYVVATAALLRSNLFNQLPAERFTLIVVPEAIALLGSRIAELRERGFRIALDLSGARLPNTVSEAFLQRIDVVRFDATRAVSGDCASLIAAVQGAGVQLMAIHVANMALFEALRGLGFHLYQGYFFAYRSHVTGDRADPRKLALLDILSKLNNDVTDKELADAFKLDPVLAVHLLRLVNSAAFGMPVRINSLQHALAVLGRGQVARWLQVLLYVLGTGREPSPLMELALRRGRFLELLVALGAVSLDRYSRDTAYMVGMLSLTPVLVHWPMENIVARLGLTQDIASALLNGAGPLGDGLTLCDALEKADFDLIRSTAELFAVPENKILAQQGEAMLWAEGICRGTEEMAA